MLDSLCFNIIFTRHTVRYLRLAALTLMERSSLRFRLVGNGITDEEAVELQSLCRVSPRFEFLDWPTGQVLPHGVILNGLAGLERGTHFCFGDSDIFALAPFDSALARAWNGQPVFSSCRRLENAPDGDYVGYMGGGATRSPEGWPLATSFFCVYERETLDRLRREYGTGFEQVYRRGQIPQGARPVLGRLGVDAAQFDTGKLLGVLCRAEGIAPAFSEIRELAHVGGLSGELMRGARDSEPMGPPDLRDDDFAHFDRTVSQRPAVGERQRGEAEMQAKRRIARYFAACLKHFIDGAPAPNLSLSPGPVRGRVESLVQSMQECHLRHRECFAAPPARRPGRNRTKSRWRELLGW